jgi:hypothetical protein
MSNPQPSYAAGGLIVEVILLDCASSATRMSYAASRVIHDRASVPK